MKQTILGDRVHEQLEFLKGKGKKKIFENIVA